MKTEKKGKYRTLEYLERRRNDPARREQAIRDARAIANYLKERHSVRVFGIGSLFDDSRSFSQRSDIDLVVEGLPGTSFFSLCGEVGELTDFKIDIIPLEDANELVLETVQERGVEL